MINKGRDHASMLTEVGKYNKLKHLTAMATTLAVAAIVLCSLASTSLSQPVNTQSQSTIVRANTLLKSWLYKDCDAGDSSVITATSFRDSSVFVPLDSMFRVSFMQGLPSEDIRSIDSASAKAYDQMQQFLKMNPQFDSTLHLRQSRSAYVVSIRNSVVDKYKRRALLGLIHVASPASKKLLQSIATDPNSLFQEVAQYALQHPN